VVAVLASPLVNVAPSMLVACIPLAREHETASNALPTGAAQVM